jgi:hypothetical protein
LDALVLKKERDGLDLKKPFAEKEKGRKGCSLFALGFSRSEKHLTCQTAV